MRLLPNVATVNVVGDSHAEVTFRNAVLEHDGLIINTETVYIESVHGATFTENGAVLAPILSALRGHRMLISGPPSPHEHGVRPNICAHPLHADRPTLFVCGDIDLRGILLRQIAEVDYRIPWRSDAEQPPPLPFLKPASFAEIHAFVQQLLKPYVDGVAQLRALGLGPVALLSIAPPTTDDDEYQRFNGYRTHRDTRYRGALLVNDTLRDLAKQSAIAFVDIWEAVTEQGYLKPDYYLDGTHLNRAAAAIAIELLLRETRRL